MGIDTKTNCGLILAEFTRTLQKRMSDCRQIARKIGNAYGVAYESHRTTLNAQKKHDEELQALKIELAFAVLSVISAGTLSWASTIAQRGIKTVAQKKVADALKVVVEKSTKRRGKNKIEWVKTTTNIVWETDAVQDVL